jgi:hypothetical protein
MNKKKQPPLELFAFWIGLALVVGATAFAVLTWQHTLGQVLQIICDAF